MKVSTAKLSEAILTELNNYTEEIEAKVAAAVIAVGRQTAGELKNVNRVSSPDGGTSNIWRTYPKGWTAKNTRSKGKQLSEVHNATQYRLTHLLENGHVIKNGTGRVYGNTRAFPHISKAETKAVELLEKKIKEVI